jgi:hypothetical protein
MSNRHLHGNSPSTHLLALPAGGDLRGALHRAVRVRTVSGEPRPAGSDVTCLHPVQVRLSVLVKPEAALRAVITRPLTPRLLRHLRLVFCFRCSPPPRASGALWPRRCRSGRGRGWVAFKRCGVDNLSWSLQNNEAPRLQRAGQDGVRPGALALRNNPST